MTLDTSHFERSELNTEGQFKNVLNNLQFRLYENVSFKVRTLDTSHFERSEVKDWAE